MALYRPFLVHAIFSHWLSTMTHVVRILFKKHVKKHEGSQFRAPQIGLAPRSVNSYTGCTSSARGHCMHLCYTPEAACEFIVMCRPIGRLPRVPARGQTGLQQSILQQPIRMVTKQKSSQD
jgi:hypothetical protein